MLLVRPRRRPFVVSEVDFPGAGQDRAEETTVPGPPPTPLHLRLLRGNPGKRGLRPEPEPPREAECPEPPPFVTGFAADEWWRAAHFVRMAGDPDPKAQGPQET